MTDSNRTSASTGFPTPVDDGTPVGHPTPAGGPASSDQLEFFPDASPCPAPSAAGAAVTGAIGDFVLAWGRLEQTTAAKLTEMRQSFGDVRAIGGRIRPNMQKLLAELRALVAMRDRLDTQALDLITDIDGSLQRAAQFRLIAIDGAQDAEEDRLICRDIKNGAVEIPCEEIARETRQLERIREQIAAL
ncbi:hypothetical protein SLG_38580 [Sphingobium sp. SYK-6]|uniref:hypothetical protein n=1 Tax=Sphingobium sp. (strain NBRC 103272 / SYK-6) TaxID=627192 RepID=UPI0002277FF0|nr:hypothetical protein [Sphingobium sp. SYK-6]BAK68533.1 hypothetical protein SLG_38580 [Sphingobium sp. SYK-6]